MYYFIADNAELAEDFAARYVLPCRGSFCEVDYSLYSFTVMLADFMLGARMEYKIAELIGRRLPSLSEEQHSMLQKRTSELLYAEGKSWGLYAGRGRYAAMRAAIEESMHSGCCFNACGFEQFRMQGLEQYLSAILSAAVQELIAQEEEQEYISLLKGFMQGRCGSYQTIRLILRANGNYVLQGSCKYGMLSLEGGRVYGFCDMIIAGLLCLAPQRLEVEQERVLPQHKQLISCLNKVFGDSMVLI